jgi:hypothetical protein
LGVVYHHSLHGVDFGSAFILSRWCLVRGVWCLLWCFVVGRVFDTMGPAPDLEDRSVVVSDIQSVCSISRRLTSLDPCAREPSPSISSLMHVLYDDSVQPNVYSSETRRKHRFPWTVLGSLEARVREWTSGGMGFIYLFVLSNRVPRLIKTCRGRVW